MNADVTVLSKAAKDVLAAAPETAAERDGLKEINAELMEALHGFANIGEYRELREAMANCLRPHERAGFIECFNKARAAYAKAKAKGGAA